MRHLGGHRLGGGLLGGGLRCRRLLSWGLAATAAIADAHEGGSDLHGLVLGNEDLLDHSRDG